MIKKLLASRKFVASASGALFVLLNEVLGLGVSENTVFQVVGLLAAYVVGQGVADHGKERIKAIADLGDNEDLQSTLDQEVRL